MQLNYIYMEKDVKNLYYFYPGNAVYFIEVTSFIIECMDGMKRIATGKELIKRVMYSCNKNCEYERKE